MVILQYILYIILIIVGLVIIGKVIKNTKEDEKNLFSPGYNINGLKNVFLGSIGYLLVLQSISAILNIGNTDYYSSILTVILATFLHSLFISLGTIFFISSVVSIEETYSGKKYKNPIKALKDKSIIVNILISLLGLSFIYYSLEGFINVVLTK